MFKFLSFIILNIIECTPVTPERRVVFGRAHRHPEEVIHTIPVYNIFAGDLQVPVPVTASSTHLQTSSQFLDQLSMYWQ